MAHDKHASRSLFIARARSEVATSRLPSRLLLVLILLVLANGWPAFAQTDSVARHESACRGALQCNVSTGASKRWSDFAIEQLCVGTTDAIGTVECFKDQMQRHGDARQAIAFCRRQRGLDTADPSGAPYGIGSVMTIVNHTKSDQYILVVGRSVTTQGKISQTADVERIYAKGERSFFGLVASDTYVAHSVYVTTDRSKAETVRNNIAAYQIVPIVLDALVNFGGKSSFETPREISLQSSKVLFDASSFVRVNAQMPKPLFLAIEGDAQATRITEHPNLYRARILRSVETLRTITHDNRCLSEGAPHQHSPIEEKFWFDANDSDAKDKGCSQEGRGSRVFEVRCEAVNKFLHKGDKWVGEFNPSAGNLGCKPMVGRRPFLGLAMVADPEPMKDKEWTRVRVDEASCRLSSFSKSVDEARNRNNTVLERNFGVEKSALPGPQAAANVADWATGDRAQYKSCNGGGFGIYHVRCELPNGEARRTCSDVQIGRKMQGGTVVIAKRLADPGTSEVWVQGACRK